jgi:hypothetical protein
MLVLADFDELTSPKVMDPNPFVPCRELFQRIGGKPLDFPHPTLLEGVPLGTAWNVTPP